MTHRTCMHTRPQSGRYCTNRGTVGHGAPMPARALNTPTGEEQQQ